MTSERFSSLPEPVRLEQTVAVHDVRPEPPEERDDVRETRWMLRYAAV